MVTFHESVRRSAGAALIASAVVLFVATQVLSARVLEFERAGAASYDAALSLTMPGAVGLAMAREPDLSHPAIAVSDQFGSAHALRTLLQPSLAPLLAAQQKTWRAYDAVTRATSALRLLAVVAFLIGLACLLVPAKKRNTHQRTRGLLKQENLWGYVTCGFDWP